MIHHLNILWPNLVGIKNNRQDMSHMMTEKASMKKSRVISTRDSSLIFGL